MVGWAAATVKKQSSSCCLASAAPSAHRSTPLSVYPGARSAREAGRLRPSTSCRASNSLDSTTLTAWLKLSDSAQREAEGDAGQLTCEVSNQAIESHTRTKKQASSSSLTLQAADGDAEGAVAGVYFLRRQPLHLPPKDER